ncbi:MAG TPA: AI-2E family transporter [Thermomicrobiales bacterium]|nr:AI-2E family transporter [Thermomicrobiales bacterium]
MNGGLTLRLTNRALLLALVGLGLVWLIIHATHIFVVFFIAILLAASVSNAARQLGRFRIPRPLAILLLYLAILLVLAGVIALLVPLIVNEINLLMRNLPTYERQLDGLLARLPTTSGQPLQINDIVASLGAPLQSIAITAGKRAPEVGSALVTILLIFVIAFFLAVDERFAERVVGRFFPPALRPRAVGILERIGTGLGYWVHAQLLLAFFFGFCFGIGLLVARVPYALTLGTVGGVLEIIPYVGGFVTVVLAAVLAATTGKLWLVIVAVGWYLIVVNVEAHVVAPKLVGEIVGLHPLVVVVALFLGAEWLGILGALLAVPLAVVAQVLLDEFWTFPGTPASPTPENGREVAAPAPAAEGPPPSAAGSRYQLGPARDDEGT